MRNQNVACESQEKELLIDPVTGEVVSARDVDELCAALGRVKECLNLLAVFRRRCIESLLEMATGDARTRRVRGRIYEAKIVAPERCFDQSRLRSVANAYPQFAGEYLREERYAVNLVPFKKLANTTATDPAFRTFQKMLMEAEREPTALPSVTVEVVNDGNG